MSTPSTTILSRLSAGGTLNSTLGSADSLPQERSLSGWRPLQPQQRLADGLARAARSCGRNGGVEALASLGLEVGALLNEPKRASPSTVLLLLADDLLLSVVVDVSA